MFSFILKPIYAFKSQSFLVIFQKEDNEILSNGIFYSNDIKRRPASVSSTHTNRTMKAETTTMTTTTTTMTTRQRIVTIKTRSQSSDSNTKKPPLPKQNHYRPST